MASVAQLPEGDPERGAIEEYLAAQVREGDGESVKQLSVFGSGCHLQLFWSMISVAGSVCAGSAAGTGAELVA